MKTPIGGRRGEARERVGSGAIGKNVKFAWMDGLSDRPTARPDDTPALDGGVGAKRTFHKGCHGRTDGMRASSGKRDGDAGTSGRFEAFSRYTVRKGQTLSDVARETRTRAEVILLLNPHASAKGLTAGSVLEVPMRAVEDGGRGGGAAKTNASKGHSKENSADSSNGKASAEGASSSGSKASKGGKDEKNDKAVNDGADKKSSSRGRSGTGASGKAETHRSFSGEMYRSSYPVLERRSKELRSEMNRVRDDTPAGKFVGEIFERSKEGGMALWRKMTLHVVAKSSEGDAKQQEQAKKKEASKKKQTEPKKAVAPKPKAESKKVVAPKPKAEPKKAVKQEQKSKATTPSGETDHSVKDIAWTLLFTVGMGLVGRGLKMIGEKYHIAEDTEEGEEWHPSTLWKWTKDKLVFLPCKGGGMCLTLRDENADPDAPVKPRTRVGSTSNYITSTNFAARAAPVEKVIIKQVKKTQTRLQALLESMKIRSIDDLTENVSQLERLVKDNKFEDSAERLKAREKLEETKSRLTEARGILSQWVDHSADSAYKENLKRKVLAAWVEVLPEVYRRKSIMTKVFVRWQQRSMAAAFNTWYENAHQLKVLRLRQQGEEIQQKLKEERKRLEEKRIEDAERQIIREKETQATIKMSKNQRKKRDKKLREQAEKNAFAERLDAAAKDSLV